MMNDVVRCCKVCGETANIRRCSKCTQVFYCSQEHQRLDWRSHKRVCHPPGHSPGAASTSVQQPENRVQLPEQGTSESEILSARAEPLANENLDFRELIDEKDKKFLPSTMLVGDSDSRLNVNFRRSLEEQQRLEDLCMNLIRDMNAYGVCVMDKFLGDERGNKVRDEVINMYSAGLFKDGQLVSNKGRRDLRHIRGDKIIWINGKEPGCRNIDYLINQVDSIITIANKMKNNGKLGQYTIRERTMAMVACYPGSGSHYVKHVDNPNRDGRCITAIYYLNPNWDVHQDGGLLRIFPEGSVDQVADIPPLFDRILFFWSDRRNPHEVQPSHRTRYAITLWYLDAKERETALLRYQKEKDCNKINEKNNIVPNT
ncbi:prolyl hydroxylase EGLN3 [Lutzomyia longipalpis]|uniref:hypoxia-inducible factor-proline dioxygenase n=2 Tax=Lutzomyia longipalpis TaxID=7200 RepID=A0A1B0CS93_LUTLO|nr:prolyl hydroxylase EGLN3 [Lutzomyia longipalpis]